MDLRVRTGSIGRMGEAVRLFHDPSDPSDLIAKLGQAGSLSYDAIG